MKTFFSPCASVDADDIQGQGVFSVADKYFYNYVEFGTNPGGIDEVSIVDGCGRYMPVCIDDVPDLIAALQDMYQTAQEIALAERVLACVNSNFIQYVEDTNVSFDPKSLPAVAK